MIRLTLLSLAAGFLIVYAWKDWFKTLCGLIVMTAVLEHPDMPKAMLGVPGLNVWNLVFLSIVLAWMRARRIENLTWDAPSNIRRLFVLYIVVMCIGSFRLFFDHSGMTEYANIRGKIPDGLLSYVNDYLFNSIKFLVPGLLLFTGCQTRARLRLAALSIVILYFIIGILVVRAMKLGSFFMPGDDLQEKALKVLSSNVGYHRVNLSMMMSGAFWAIYSCREMITGKAIRAVLLGGCGVTAMAMALTGGRMGYVAWGVLCLSFAVMRWRRFLLVVPAVLFVVIPFMPSIVDRVSFGFVDGEDSTPDYVEDYYIVGDTNLYELTSGRVLAWPLVLDGIKDAPILGHGREAMRNAGISAEMYLRYGAGDTFAHPHNAYLQWILDNGIIGFVIVFLLFYHIVRHAVTLFRDSRDPAYIAVGGMCVALVGALLIASAGSQSFYPREGALGMWCAIGLMMRLFVDRSKIINDLSSEKPHPDAGHHRAIVLEGASK